METDFAPAWLKMPSSLKSSKQPQQQPTNGSSSSQQPLKEEPSISLRPHYLKSNGEKGTKGTANAAISKEPPTQPKKELSSLELAFREQLDFAHHVPTKSSAAHTLQSANSRTHSLEENNGSGGDGNTDGTNGSQHLNNRRSYQRLRLDEKQRQARPHSRHDFRELAAFQTHSKPEFKKNVDSKNNSNEEKQSDKINGTGKKDTFLEEFPSLASDTPIQESKTFWDSAQAKAKVLNGRVVGQNLTTLSLTSKLAPKASTTDPVIQNKKKPAVTKLKDVAAPMSIASGVSKKLPVTNIFKKWTSTSPTLTNGVGNSPSMEVLVKSTIKTRINQKPSISADAGHQQSPSRTSSVSSSQSEKSETQKPPADSQQQQQVENGIQISKINGHQSFGFDKEAKYESNEYPDGAFGKDNNRDEPDSITSNNSSREEDFSDQHQEQKYSASLEAEMRLLREMGWQDEEDDSECVGLTEDEVREFQNMVNMRGPIRRPKFELQLNARNNKLQNDPFSPAHLKPIANKPPAESDDSSSSESSDDEDDSGLLI